MTDNMEIVFQQIVNIINTKYADKLPTEDDEVGSYVHKCNRCGYETTSGFVIDPERFMAKLG